ncbi:trehalose-phosphatase [Natronolimnohabitans innermongolicus]|uniref:Trehalose 6-phosphate phosphatase n=1 Tax=Natronolimnohabitans innermongolicus JCM 12255 TaxID=1227499 RepID=L9WH94_9EURY|nr:trehalose-phosphatase [Natronolimnohabitans innermongolicus]ELY48880.1 trehalose-phosphatase [Natronolimnohabitans innermongolicus JCM 12255]
MSVADARETPAPLSDVRPRLRSRLTGASRLVCCLDFDGTLAPIVDDPEAATATAANEAAVATLSAEPSVTTAVVSGRALADVRERIDGPSTYAGNHGLELEREDSVAVHPVASKRAARIEAVCTTLEDRLADVPNVRIENKRLTGTVHFRSVPEDVRPEARRRTRETVERLGGDALEVSSGKRILEIEPSIPWGKGNAVALIAADAPDDAVPIYVGDDVTDESAFETVEPEGIGVRVGGDEPSAASARLESPDAVATFLEWLGSTGVELLDSE